MRPRLPSCTPSRRGSCSPATSSLSSDASQTEQFFASTWDQYEGVQTLDKQIVVMAEAPASVWADVTWFHDGEPLERLCYQLIGEAGSYQIGVLTPLPLV